MRIVATSQYFATKNFQWLLRAHQVWKNVLLEVNIAITCKLTSAHSNNEETSSNTLFFNNSFATRVLRDWLQHSVGNNSGHQLSVHELSRQQLLRGSTNKSLSILSIAIGREDKVPGQNLSLIHLVYQRPLSIKCCLNVVNFVHNRS